jgi:nucleotide-binding universal stress UspA family protein
LVRDDQLQLPSTNGVDMISDHAGWTGYHVKPGRHPDPSTAPACELVVALDGSVSAERSLEVADALAAAAELPLRVVTVRPNATDIASTESYFGQVTRRVPRVSEVTVDHSTDVADALAAAAGDGALVVLATHARRALGNVVFGSVADRVLHVSDRPVLLVGPNAGVSDPMFTTMVVPDDGGEGSRRLRPLARAWSEHLGAVPWIVQVLSGQGADPAMEVLEAAHVEYVARHFGPEAEWDVLHGTDPAERIVTFAGDRRAGLIAMAVPGRHRVGPDICGGVALQVIRGAPCPVLALGRADH